MNTHLTANGTRSADRSRRPVALALMLAGLLVSIPFGEARASYITKVLGDNPLAYYRMQESNPADNDTAADSSGNANDGTYQYDVGGSGPASMTDIAGAMPNLTPGKQYNIAGTEDGASIDIPGVAAAPVSAFTIEFFIRPSANTYSSGLLGLFTTDGGFAPGDVHLNISNSNLELAVANTSSFPSINLASLVPVNEWGHVAVTYEVTGATTADIRFYVNGANVGGTFTIGSPQLASLNGTSAIGQWGTSRDFNGGLDEFAIYGVALTGDQILTHLVPAPGAMAGGIVLLTLAGLRRRITH